MRLRVLGFFGRFVAQAIANSECNFVLNALNELNFWNVLLVSFPHLVLLLYSSSYFTFFELTIPFHRTYSLTTCGITLPTM